MCGLGSDRIACLQIARHISQCETFMVLFVHSRPFPTVTDIVSQARPIFHGLRPAALVLREQSYQYSFFSILLCGTWYVLICSKLVVLR